MDNLPEQEQEVAVLEIEVDAQFINALSEQLTQAVISGLLNEEEALRAADDLLDMELPNLVKLQWTGAEKL